MIKSFHAIVAAVAIALIMIPFPACAQSPSIIEVGRFSAEKRDEGLPTHWRLLTYKKIKRYTTYSLVRHRGRIVLMAVADASASALIREIKINPKEYPIVQWRWEVENIIEKGDIYRKEGDDYPARLYITFEYDASKLDFLEKIKYELARLAYGQYPPTATIDYIWANNAPEETLVPNPYTDRVMMMVVESGSTKLKQWVTEERNLYEDFRKAFGYEPPLISGVAIMTDTDNTNERVTAYYGDILFKKDRNINE
jgi:hypothetical protein